MNKGIAGLVTGSGIAALSPPNRSKHSILALQKSQTLRMGFSARVFSSGSY